MNTWRVLAVIGLVALMSPAGSRAAEQPLKTNLVLIMTDNHGPWTLGCYGNPDVRTPNIDRLAAQGTRFANAFANNAVCSPTRATVLTGLMPSQHGVHCYLRGGGAQVGPGAYCTIEEFRTLPKILQQAGYVCGLTGKWHLGGNMTPQEGFTTWITKPHGASAGFYDQQVIEDGKIRTEPTYLTELWTDHAVQFIEQHREQPFFLFVAYNGPYGLGSSMREPVRNRHREYVEQQTFESFPREEPHPWGHNYPDWIGDLQVIRKYAAEISAVDDGVGRILQSLDANHLRERTLVVFMSDQGLAGGQSGFWGMGDHTRPLTAYDWTITIPLIVSQPGQVASGHVCTQMVANYDLLPTLLDFLKLDGGFDDAVRLPGRSFADALAEERLTDWQEVVYYEFENVRAVRTPKWKYIERFRQEPNELYDLQADPGERRNLIDQNDMAPVRREMKDRMDRFFAHHADPQWDLWQGGRSKTDLITRDLFGLPKNPEGREKK